MPLVERAAPRRRERVETPAAPGAAPARVRSGQASGLLAQRAAVEYAYVAKDVRHIAVVGGGLFVLLIVLYVVLEVLHVVKV
jgi:hypothetical protein